MSDIDSLQFRNKSISQLVQQLNNLGGDHVIMQPSTLIAIQDQPSESIRRFRSKSLQKTISVLNKQYGNSNEGGEMSEFFLVDGSQKKYYYDEIVNDLETTIVGKILNKFQQNFNTTILTQYNHQRFQELLQKIQPFIENTNTDKYFYANFIQFQSKQIIDLLSASSHQRTLTLAEACDKNKPVYQCKISDLLRVKQISQGNIKILRITKKIGSGVQIRIILLPEGMFLHSIQDPVLKIVKAQLSQMINYIKTNPNKKYQNINKLLPKRFPTTTAIAELLLYDSANYVIHWVTDCNDNKNVVNGRFDFYGRITSITNLAKRVEGKGIHKNMVKSRKDQSKSPKPCKPITNLVDLPNQVISQNKKPDDGTQIKSMNQIQYCRTFQRKTHKYSIADFDSIHDDKLFPQTLQNYPPLSPQLTQPQALTILKAQHARQLSQYHQTIQNLNQKILALTSQKGLNQIFTIHQRQIMLLELKIDELRKDITKICTTQSKQKDIQNLKDIIRKLNEQISQNQKINPSYKLSQGKIKMMEHQISQWKDKYHRSQIARKQLKLELQAATNRLKIKDEQTKKLMQRQEKLYKDEDLSSKQLSILQQIQQLSKNGLNKQNAKYLCRKFKNTLGEVSQLRQTLLQCHNFLVDLQQHIQSRLAEKDPDVVLDCNKFIRTYLLNNLNIL